MMASQYIDNYCERLAVGLLGEPLNAITNATFLIAAWLLWKQYKASQIQDRPVAVLIALVGVIGIGSLSFHTFANHVSMLADIIPITIFVFFYLWLISRKLLGFTQIQSACFQIALLFAAILTTHIPAEYSFNGSIMYFPCLAALLVIGTILSFRHHPAARSIYLASMLFIISLTFRSMDMSMCDTFPIGTHFMWHICNGMLLYLLTRELFPKRISATN